MADTESKSTAADQKYAGFWIRVAAALIDGVIVMIILTIIGALMGDAAAYFDASSSIGPIDYITWVILFIYSFVTVGIWGGTPGKLMLGLRIVKEDGSKIGWGQVVLREIIGKFISQIVIMLGYLWVAFDKRKQGWHDKIAGTVVIKVQK